MQKKTLIKSSVWYKTIYFATIAFCNILHSSYQGHISDTKLNNLTTFHLFLHLSVNISQKPLKGWFDETTIKKARATIYVSLPNENLKTCSDARRQRTSLPAKSTSRRKNTDTDVSRYARNASSPLTPKRRLNTHNTMRHGVFHSGSAVIFHSCRTHRFTSRVEQRSCHSAHVVFRGPHVARHDF